MPNLDPFAAAGFAPASSPPTVAAAPSGDPFAMAGFAPEAGAVPPGGHLAFGPSGFTPTNAPDISTSEQIAAYLNPLSQPMGYLRAAEKLAEGATYGMFPYVAAGARALAGTPFQQGLAEQRAYTAQTSQQHPLLGATLETAGSLLPTAGIMGAAAPATRAISAIPWAGSPLAQALLGGTVGAASTAGSRVGSGQTENLGPAVARGAGVGAAIGAAAPVVGATLQALPNIVRSGYAGVRNIFTTPGKEAVAGQILREAGDDFANTAARAPIPDLSLRTAQATGNPGIAALERTLASEPGMAAGLPGDIVQGGRTPNQTATLARALVGSNAGIEPAVLTNQASATGVEALQTARDALRQTEAALWNAPALSAIKPDAAALVSGVKDDIAGMAPSFRRAIQQGPLAGFVDDIAALPQNAGLADVNAVRSNILEQARASRASGDAVTASAAQQLADSVLDRTQNALGSLGSAARDAWTAARDFTRQRAQTLGYPEFDAIFRPNAAGNMRADPESVFGRFFNLSSGSGTGLQRLQNVTDLLRASGTPETAAAADQLQGAAQDYLKAAILKTSRAGAGLDAAGMPALNTSTLASTVNRSMPEISTTPITAPIAGDIQAAGNAAELLSRPASLRGDMNSTTFEKLRNRDLVGAVLGQAGASSLGAAAGGIAAGRYGPEEIPWYLRVPGGMLAGAMLGQEMGPYVGKAIAHIPGASLAVTGPTADVLQRVGTGLANPAEYQRLIQSFMLPGPEILTPGMISQGVPAAATAAIPALTRSGAR